MIFGFGTRKSSSDDPGGGQPNTGDNPNISNDLRQSKLFKSLSKLTQKDPRYLRLIADCKIRSQEEGVDSKILQGQQAKLLRELSDTLTLEFLDIRKRYTTTTELVAHTPNVDIVMLSRDLQDLGIAVPNKYLTIDEILKGVAPRPRSLPEQIKKLGV